LVGPTGIKIWHFPRTSIPGDITAKTPNPANWGKPVAFWSSSTCDIASHFQDQVITVGSSILPIKSAFDYVSLTQRSAVIVSDSSCISRIKQNFRDGKRGRKCFSWGNVCVCGGRRKSSQFCLCVHFLWS
jgi:hypothetical protein